MKNKTSLVRMTGPGCSCQTDDSLEIGSNLINKCYFDYTALKERFNNAIVMSFYGGGTGLVRPEKKDDICSCLDEAKEINTEYVLNILKLSLLENTTNGNNKIASALQTCIGNWSSDDFQNLAILQALKQTALGEMADNLAELVIANMQAEEAKEAVVMGALFGSTLTSLTTNTLSGGITGGTIGAVTGAIGSITGLFCSSFDCRIKEVEKNWTSEDTNTYRQPVIDVFRQLNYDVTKDLSILNHEMYAMKVRMTIEKKTFQQWQEQTLAWIKAHPDLYSHIKGITTQITQTQQQPIQNVIPPRTTTTTTTDTGVIDGGGGGGNQEREASTQTVLYVGGAALALGTLIYFATQPKKKKRK